MPASHRIWILNAALVAVAAPLCLTLGGEPAVAGPRLPAWALVALFAGAEVCVVHVHFRRSSHSFTLAELPLVAGLAFAHAQTVAVAWALGGGLALALVVRMRPARLVFNVALFGLSGAVTTLAADALAPWWAGALAGVLAASTTSVALIAVALALTGERLHVARVSQMLAMAWPFAATNAALGIAVVTLLAVDPWNALTLVPVGATLLVAYRALTAERAKHASLEFIHAAVRTLARASEARLGLAGVLAMALENFRAETAEALLLPLTAEVPGARIAIGGDQRVEMSALHDEALIAELESLGERARIVTPETTPGALGAELRRLGVERGLLAALAGEERPLGALLIANRAGLGAFDRADLALFETLAQHAGSALGQDRLGRQVRELDALRGELEHRAFHDPLTGVANRLLFMDRLRHAMTRREGSVAVIYIDLDDFKPVNDTLGHEAGDELLRTVAARLDESLRAEDTPARLGGDEFAVLLLDVGEREAGIVADRIIRALRRPVPVAGTERVVHASLGIAVAASGTATAEEILRNADAAMYVSKHGGKRGYRIYDNSMEVR